MGKVFGKLLQNKMTSIYILRLLRGKFYVGKSKKPFNRISQHFSMRGSTWTKKYHPLQIIDIINNCDGFDEDKWTKIYMHKYGIENVRGGSFCKPELTKEEIKYLERSIRGATDSCFICGGKHFVSNCPFKGSIAT